MEKEMELVSMKSVRESVKMKAYWKDDKPIG